MAEKKSTVLAVLEVLQSETDEIHLLTGKEIMEKVEERRGLKMAMSLS